MKLFPKLLLLLWLLLPLSLNAAPVTANSAPITIEADQLELDQRRGTSHYRGNVLLTQGGLQIKAARLTLYSAGQQLQRVEITGNPATLSQQGETPQETLRAEAQRMEYQPREGLIVLRGAAQLWRDGNEFSGDEIRYDLKRQRVKASGDAEQGGGRVRVLLQPEGTDLEMEEQP